MTHKLLPIETLLIEDGYNSVRSNAELKANVADVVKQMEQAKDEPTAFPIRFVLEGDTRYTRNHATLLAARERGWENVYAIELPHARGSVEDLSDLIVSNNGGHPISRVRQGEHYKKMRDGELKPDIENGAEVTDESWLRKPMTTKEIAESLTPIYTEQHIKDCITLADSSPEVRELIEGDLVSCNIVVTALQWAKGDQSKQLRILKTAVREADGVKATKKHMDAIKSQFVEMKAAKPADESEPAVNKPKKGAQSHSNGESAELPLGDERTDSGESDADQLFAQATASLLEEGSKKNKQLLGALETFFLDTDGLEKLGITMSLTDEESKLLAEKVVEIVTNAATVF